MPNTRSAARRARSSERRRQHNRRRLSAVRKLEKQFLAAANAGNKDEAAKLLPQVTAAYDKAAKGSALHKGTADRKKSRLALRLNKVK